MNLWQRIQAIETELRHRAEKEKGNREAEARLRHELHAALDSAKHVDHSRPVPRWGIDYAWGRPHPAALHAAGVTFAVRYLGGSQSKDLTRVEAENLSHAGIDVVVVWEAAGDAALGGYDAGARDAHRAEAQAKACGMPGGRPIYFAVDFDAAGMGKVEPVLEYLRGAVHAIGWQRVGVYAGLGVIEAAQRQRRCKYLWQTLAWSGGAWSPHAQLQQRVNGRRIDGVDVDLDRAVAADFGQWKV